MAKQSPPSESVPTSRDPRGSVPVSVFVRLREDKPQEVKWSPNGLYQIHWGDCFEWLRSYAAAIRAGKAEAVHAVVTDPPYGLVEFSEREKAKLRGGNGGVWRIPPSYDGCRRRPLPRFTILKDGDQLLLHDFFAEWAGLVFEVLVPGAQVVVATNPLLSDVVSMALRGSGLEKRGEIIRLVQTLRGGDRPKNAHDEYTDVTVMPRSCHEPWLVFRKPCDGRVQDTLRKYGTGGFRRVSDTKPFRDVIVSSPTRSEERAIANHPSLKPQSFMRQLVRAVLPLGKGVVLDPFMGGGSTIAAAVSVGYYSVGIELDQEYFSVARRSIPKLAGISVQADRQSDS